MASRSRKAQQPAQSSEHGSTVDAVIQKPIASFTDEQLRVGMKSFDIEIKRRRNQRCAELVNHVINECDRLDLSALEIIQELRARMAQMNASGVTDAAETPAKGSTVAGAVFRHPDDPTKQWGGRGKHPAWLKKLLDDGFTLDALRVSD